MEARRIKCCGVPYRQGWVEISANIHAGYVNLEAWHVVPKIDLQPDAISLASISDAAVSSNVELELTLTQAKQLLAALQQALAEVDTLASDPVADR